METIDSITRRRTQTLTFLLGLLADPRKLYRQTGLCGRRVLDQAFFSKLYFDSDAEGPYAAADDLADLANPLVSETGNDSGTAQMGGAAVGSRKNPLVELLSAYSNSRDAVERTLRELGRCT